MQQITEQQILALAPNSTAASNGKKISKSGGFVRLACSLDDTFYFGECKGSGSKNYSVSADFIEPLTPVFRCSCPSRQFPCKHSLGLLYEMLENKTFETCEIPSEILTKREKKQAKEIKKEENSSEEKAQAKKKTSKAAVTKKVKKQLEGLELTEKLIQNLLQAGLGTIGGTDVTTYRQLSKQLGDYYLSGPQRLLNQLILEIEAFQKDQKEYHYEAAIDVLKKLWNLTKKSKEYLQGKLEQEQVDTEANVLVEELGGIWKLSELEALGRSKENASLIQLAFWVTYHEVRKEYIDTGCFIDMETGEVVMTYNYRPVKALNYVKAEDSIFDKLQIPKLISYPGDGNLRVRWEASSFERITKEDMKKIYSFAIEDLNAEAKVIKNLLKNPLSPSMWIRLISYEMIGRVENEFVLQTKTGATILLKDSKELEPTVEHLSYLPSNELLQNQVLVGAFYYEPSQQRLLLQPLSIISKECIIRLLY